VWTATAYGMGTEVGTRDCTSLDEAQHAVLLMLGWEEEDIQRASTG
jgi:hypothetical protein